MNLASFSKDVHKNAVEHGWWEDERDFGSIVALCHSEISEALEEYRAWRPMVYGDECEDLQRITDIAEVSARGLKPEGIAVELADCVIRIMDWFGKNRIDPEAEMAEGLRLSRLVFVKGTGGDVATLFADLHLCLSMAYKNWRNGHDSQNVNPHMGLCVALIFEWAKKNNLDMEEILQLKHEYNKRREYRHGGKLM